MMAKYVFLCSLLNLFINIKFIFDFDFSIFQTNLAIDYDPKNLTDHVRYICLADRTKFEPNATTQSILREYTIPPEYTVCSQYLL